MVIEYSEQSEECILTTTVCDDSDTLAVINGSIAEAFYGGVPEEI